MYILHSGAQQDCRNSGMMEPRIPAICDICRQFWLYLQTNHTYLQTNHTYLYTILPAYQNYMKKMDSSGNSIIQYSPGVSAVCTPRARTVVHSCPSTKNAYSVDQASSSTARSQYCGRRLYSVS